MHLHVVKHNSNSYATNTTLRTLSAFQQGPCIPGCLLPRPGCSNALHFHQFQFHGKGLVRELYALKVFDHAR